MDPTQSRQLDLYEGGSMNSGPYYPNQPGVHPAEGSRSTPPPHPTPGQKVRHTKSGETGQVTGYHVHGHTGERFAQVRWDGQPSKGFTQDQGYSLDSLTNP